MSKDSSTWKRWGISGVKKALVVSDYVGVLANQAAARAGVERFWPTSGDFQMELDKCERILRLFTVEGIATEEKQTADPQKKVKVFRKIPPEVLREAKGIVIFNSMRTGIAPFAGAGGAGIIIVRLKSGEWSAPSFVTPNNFSAGLMLGVDVYSCILILRTEAAIEGFRTHHLTLGSEMGVAAGPLGYGMSAETGLKNRTPVFSYVVTKGFYAGVGIVGQAFIDRFDENERVYHWPGIKAGDIFDGKVRRPPESISLYKALIDAELGVAQGANLEWDNQDVKELDLLEGEVLRLPPTPDQLSAFEAAGIQDEDDVQRDQEERKAVRAMPPPPRHPHARNSSLRKIDSGVLTGKTGTHSPASECSTPDNQDVERFDTSAEMSPHMRRYHFGNSANDMRRSVPASACNSVDIVRPQAPETQVPLTNKPEAATSHAMEESAAGLPAVVPLATLPESRTPKGESVP